MDPGAAVRAAAGRFLAGTALALTWACAHGGPPDIATLSSNSDQVIWEAGEKAAGKKEWEAARQHFRRIIDAFPQSRFGPAARVALADSYFDEGGTANHVLAASSYREFLTLYPSHPRSDYAQFRVGESHWKQRNSPDRDQTPTRQALEEFGRLLENYPDSPHVEEARLRIAEARRSLARSEFLVGLFYQRTRRACHSAIPRYETVVRSYPDYPALDEALFRLAQCLAEGDRRAEALPHVGQLLSDFPASPFAPDARKLQAEIEARGPVAAPSPSPGASPSPEAP